jgi:NAD(P)-dependent dehydrogenase (short-subunit alcohol dehydrogenase family)
MRVDHRWTAVEGRSTIVTGAGNGLGLAIARRFVAAGAKVLLVDRDPTVASRIGEEDFPKGSAFALVKDLADEDAASSVFRIARETLSHVDTLINNAAWSLHKPILEMTLLEFDQLIGVNQRAPYFLAQEFLRYVSESPKVSDPTIINIASVNALAGNRNVVAYAGTKGALVAMTRAMAVEMAPFGIRVNSISPGAIDTPAAQRVFREGLVDISHFFDGFLIKRFTSCEEIAELVVYLCSKASACVTGANWVIDGGYLAR